MVDEPSRTTVAPAPATHSVVTVLVLRAVEQDVLVLLGEADLATADLLRAQVLRALPPPPRPVLVELGALTVSDLDGLDALRSIAGAAASAGAALTFRGQSAQLRWLQRTSLRSRGEEPALAVHGGRPGAPC